MIFNDEHTWWGVVMCSTLFYSSFNTNSDSDSLFDLLLISMCVRQITEKNISSCFHTNCFSFLQPQKKGEKSDRQSFCHQSFFFHDVLVFIFLLLVVHISVCCINTLSIFLLWFSELKLHFFLSFLLACCWFDWSQTVCTCGNSGQRKMHFVQGD